MGASASLAGQHLAIKRIVKKATLSVTGCGGSVNVNSNKTGEISEAPESGSDDETEDRSENEASDTAITSVSMIPWKRALRATLISSAPADMQIARAPLLQRNTWNLLSVMDMQLPAPM